MYTRRDFGKIALAALPASTLLAQKKINSTIGGVLGSVTRIALRYDEPTKTSLLTISSTTITFKEIFDKD